MRSAKMESRVLLVAFCCLTLGSLSEGMYGKHIPNVLIIGKVNKASHFIQGASVVLECGDGMSLKVWKEAILNEHGEFRVHMPASFSRHHSTTKSCSVKLMSSTEPNCAVASTITTTLVHLNSRKDKGSLRIYSAGLLTFSPLKKSSLCGQKQNLEAHTDEEVTSMKNTIRTAELTKPFFQHFPSFDPKLTPSLPRLPQLSPLPQLPPLPTLPSPPTLPKPQLSTPKPVEEINQKPNVIDQKVVPSTFPFPFPPNPLQPPSLPLPPNPLLPPPGIFPPIPGLTPPPSGILPPLPGLTPPSSGILPPIPVLTPPPPPASILPPLPGIPTLPGVPGFPGFASPPPPPPPSLLPPFPFPPGFPGIPPVTSKSSGQP